MGFFEEIKGEIVWRKGSWLDKANLFLLSSTAFIFSAIFGMMIMEYPLFFSSQSVFAAQDRDKDKKEIAYFLDEKTKMSQALGSLNDSVKVLSQQEKTRQAAAARAAQARRLLSAAPKPLAETKTVDGKRVCATKNDKPHKSHKTDEPHMDMECCPDPDEWPNPHCYYTPEQLSWMLKPPG